MPGNGGGSGTAGSHAFSVNGTLVPYRGRAVHGRAWRGVPSELAAGRGDHQAGPRGQQDVLCQPEELTVRLGCALVELCV